MIPGELLTGFNRLRKKYVESYNRESVFQIYQNKRERAKIVKTNDSPGIVNIINKAHTANDVSSDTDVIVNIVFLGWKDRPA